MVKGTAIKLLKNIYLDSVVNTVTEINKKKKNRIA